MKLQKKKEDILKEIDYSKYQFKIIKSGEKKIKYARFLHINSVYDLQIDLQERESTIAILSPNLILGHKKFYYLNNYNFLILDKFYDNGKYFYDECYIMHFNKEELFEIKIIEFNIREFNIVGNLNYFIKYCRFISKIYSKK